MLEERWLPIRGYEGRYEISDHGNVRSVTRYRRGKSGCLVPVPEKIMRVGTKKRSSNGRTLPYKEIKLRDGSPRHIHCKSFLVHRLVAQAFIGELFEGCHVDHIDGNHGNNHYTNLRILSAREHSLLNPISNPEKNSRMQKLAKEKIVALREAGIIVGKFNITKKANC